MALPTSRDKTFAAGSEIPSATLNALQDGIVEHNEEIHGTRTLVIGGHQLKTIAGTPTLTEEGPLYATNADEGYLEIPALVGERINAIRVKVRSGAVGFQMTPQRRVTNASTAATDLASMQDSDGTTYESFTFDTSATAVLAVNEKFRLKCYQNGTNAGTRLLSVEVDLVKP